MWKAEFSYLQKKKKKERKKKPNKNHAWKKKKRLVWKIPVLISEIFCPKLFPWIDYPEHIKYSQLVSQALGIVLHPTYYNSKTVTWNTCSVLLTLTVVFCGQVDLFKTYELPHTVILNCCSCSNFKVMFLSQESEDLLLIYLQLQEYKADPNFVIHCKAIFFS